MGYGFEAEEVRFNGRRIDNKDVEPRIGFDMKSEFPIRPMGVRPSVLPEKDVVDPMLGKHARLGEIPFRTRGNHGSA
jgi:hypothetical protein